MSKESLFVNEFTSGILDPKESMLGPVKDGGVTVANTAPGCWRPMITSELRGGHEVTKPVYVENAEVGDAIAIFIKSVDVTSEVVSSVNEFIVDKNFVADPFVAGKCPGCDTLYPKTVLEGIGSTSGRCANCNEEIAPFQFTNGYTITFDEAKTLGVTLTKEGAEKAAEDAKSYMAIPDESIQNPIVRFAPHDIVGNISRLKPFIGQLGTVAFNKRTIQFTVRCKSPCLLIG